MITLEEFLMGRDRLAPLTAEMREDAIETVKRVNNLLTAFGMRREVTSGYRPKTINDETPGASKTSKHMVCKACDLEDIDGRLDRFCVAHQDDLTHLGLWLESPTDTPNWCHVQTVPPPSGHRIFIAK